MARLNSFYLAPAHWADPYSLDGPEAAHLLKVLRARPGERVRLFDGRGREGIFVLARADRRQAWLEPEGITVHDRPRNRPCLALGWNKAGRRDLILEKAVELQAGAMVFWRSERSQGDLPEAPKPGWSATMIQAAKQCGNPWLPEIILAPGGWPDLAALGARFDRRILLWESAQGDALLSPGDLAAPGGSLAVFGPEGGLTGAEVEGLRGNGFTAASLGPSVLRWETAALAVLSLAFWARANDSVHPTGKPPESEEVQL